MKRMLFVGLFAVAIAARANAVSLGVVADKTVYFLGETITLTVFGSDAGVSSYGVFGQLDYSGALIDNGTRSQITLNGGIPWTRGLLPAGDDSINAFSTAFNQIAGLVAQTALNLSDTFYTPFSTVTLVAVDRGLVNVSWHTALDGFQLDFFGLTNAPGTSFYIISCDGCPPPGIPEPTTGALLGLGLVALALTARHVIRARLPIDSR
jgi:hypothetical protein